MLGCNDEAIYQMAETSNGTYEWTEMNQRLKYRRMSLLADYIDDDNDLVNCQKKSG